MRSSDFLKLASYRFQKKEAYFQGFSCFGLHYAPCLVTPLRSRASIEKAMKILEDQFELVETTRAEVSDLKKGKLGKAEEKAPLGGFRTWEYQLAFLVS